jgi:hypothetical protein
LRARLSNLAGMQTFGKRHYDHLELDPWAKRRKTHEEKGHERLIPTSRIAVYLIALVTVGIIAVAGFEMLVLA